MLGRFSLTIGGRPQGRRVPLPRWSTRRRGGSRAPIGPCSEPGLATGRGRCQPRWRGGAGLPRARAGLRAAGGGQRASTPAASCPPRWRAPRRQKLVRSPSGTCAWCLSTAPTAAPSAWRSRRGSRTKEVGRGRPPAPGPRPAPGPPDPRRLPGPHAVRPALGSPRPRPRRTAPTDSRLHPPPGRSAWPFRGCTAPHPDIPP